MSENKNSKNEVLPDENLGQVSESASEGVASPEISEGISSTSVPSNPGVSAAPTIQIPIIPNQAFAQVAKTDDDFLLSIFPPQAEKWTPQKKAYFLATFAVKGASKNKKMSSKDIAKFVQLMSKARVLFQSI